MWRLTIAVVAGCSASRLRAEPARVDVADGERCVDEMLVPEEHISLDNAIVEQAEWGPLARYEREFVLRAFDRMELVFVECQRHETPHGRGRDFIAKRRVIVPRSEQALDALGVRDVIARQR